MFSILRLPCYVCGKVLLETFNRKHAEQQASFGAPGRWRARKNACQRCSRTGGSVHTNWVSMPPPALPFRAGAGEGHEAQMKAPLWSLCGMRCSSLHP